MAVGAFDIARNLASDTALLALAVLAFDTTERFSSRAIVGPPASDATTDLPGR
jgi:hypothetical protein